MQELEILDDDPKNNVYIVRSTIYLLIFRLLQIEIGIAIILVILRVVFITFNTQLEEFIQPKYLYVSLVVIISIFNVYQIVSPILNWLGTLYIIKNGSIIIKRGVFKTSDEILTINNVESVKIHQRFLGKIFNYATLKIHTPIMKTDLVLRNIPNPGKYADYIFKYNSIKASQVLRSTASR
jgi:uncharacterized membrane protein YdbT with pleckstrin-like domain